MAGEEIIEGSKAIQEGSKFGVKALESGEKLGKFITKVIGFTDDGILGLINDKLQFFKWERQCRMADEYNRKYKDQPMKPIPPKFLIPILENGSLEDDNNLQDIWVNLLGAFTNENYKGERRMAYIDIIKSLNPLDIYILKEVYKFNYKNKRDDIKFIDISKDSLKLDIPEDDFNLSLANLYRVFCLRASLTFGGNLGKSFSITELGIKFVEACICNDKGEYKVKEVKIDCGLEVEKPIEGILKERFGESFLIIKKCELEKIKDNSFKKYSKKISGLIFEIMEDNRPRGYQNPVDLGDSFKVSKIEFKKSN